MGGKLINHPFYTSIYTIVFFLIIVPLLFTLGSVFKEGIFFQHLFSFDKSVVLLLVKSTFIAFMIAIIATFFGMILGFILYKTRLTFNVYFKIVLLIPLFVSPYVLAVAYKDFFYLIKIFSISSYEAVIFVMVLVYTPLSMLILGNALAKIDKSIEESALLIGSVRIGFINIILPLIKPAILTSFVLVFIFSISEFSVPAFFGVNVFSTEIFTQFSAFYNYSLATVQSLLLVILCIGLLYSERKYIEEAPFFTLGLKGTSSKRYQLSTSKKFVVLFLYIWLILSVLLPLGTLVFQSFQKGTSAFFKAFNLLKNTFYPSVSIALFGAASIVLLGFIAAYAAVIIKKKSLDYILLLGFAVPTVIFGISFIKFYNQTFLHWIYGSYVMILIGFVAKFSFIASKLIANAMNQIPKSLDEAAQISGAGFTKRLQFITIPLLFPTIFATFIISFIFCIGDLGMSIMLYPPGTELISIKVFTIMANASQEITASMILIVYVMTLLLLFSFYLMMKLVIKKEK